MCALYRVIHYNLLPFAAPTTCLYFKAYSIFYNRRFTQRKRIERSSQIEYYLDCFFAFSSSYYWNMCVFCACWELITIYWHPEWKIPHSSKPWDNEHFMQIQNKKRKKQEYKTKQYTCSTYVFFLFWRAGEKKRKRLVAHKSIWTMNEMKEEEKKKKKKIKWNHSQDLYKLVFVHHVKCYNNMDKFAVCQAA